MTPKSKQTATWIGIVFGAMGGLTIVGLAAQFWISAEVGTQIMAHSHNTSIQPIIQDVATIKTDVENIKINVQTAVDSQQRFEEIFMEYLQEQANR